MAGSKTSDLIKTKSCFLFNLKVFLKNSRKLPRQTILKIISTHVINNFAGDTDDWSLKLEQVAFDTKEQWLNYSLYS